VRGELDKEREERNYFQLERDKINTFWEISKKELEDRKAELRNKVSLLGSGLVLGSGSGSGPGPGPGPGSGSGSGTGSGSGSGLGLARGLEGRAAQQGDPCSCSFVFVSQLVFS
jgi:hypothetical protein